MTVTKVSEERDSETVDVYPEPLDQHTPEVDDNNNSQIGDPNSSNEMKYELRSTTAPTTATLPIRSSRLPEAPAGRLSTTSTSRGLPTSTSTASTPLLGELKRSSSSRDDISIDPESVLPERTRLRRQRRMRSQDSAEEKPEDVIERLNKLKARISGALSEVKNVIKQYSTESEAEAAGETPVVALSKPSSSAGEKEPSSAPVPFRFVKKIRRRSYFDEAEEEKEQAGEDQDKVSQEEVKETKIKREATPFPKLEKLEEKDISESNSKEVLQETEVQTKEDSKILENQETKIIEKSETKLTIECNQEPKKVEQISEATPHKVDSKESKTEIISEPKEALKVNGEVVDSKPPEKNKTQTKIEFLAKVQSELKSKPTKEKIDKKPNEVTEPTPKSQKEEHSEKPTSDVTDDSSQAGSQAQATPKIKKKVIVKVKNSRRASIAAVEPSKIKVEPAVEQSDALIAQRRPSDSEAIVKRKKKLKLMGPIADAAAAAATISTTSGYQRERTDKQATSPEAKTVPAKLAIAKSGQGEATTATEATATAAAATETEKPIDGDSVKSGNQAPSPERSRRASLKLDELVGGTLPLVVPAGKSDIPAPEPQTLRPEPPAQAQAQALPSIDESKEPINQVQSHVQVQQVAIGADIAPQIEATLRHEESSAQPSVEATKVAEQSAPADSLESAITMPELKVIAGPVQPVKIETVEQPLDVAKSDQPLVVGKKKPTTATPHLKKLVRKNSIDKKDKDVVEQQKQDSTKLSNILRDKNKINELSSRINKLTPPKKREVKPKEEPTKPEEQAPKPEEETPQEIPTEAVQDQEEEQVAEPEPEPEPAPVPKKVRKVKKKVIIKRQKRRLSIGDTFFLQPEPEEPQIPEIETIERAIAYVTDDEDEPEPQPEEKVEPEPRKSCLHVREYKIGDLILYAERYRKTQVRWKRGRVLERITSISYKLEIEGKEVPAHVSYIKKYTGRKVRFGGKEYLEIDYEQVAEEERRAASYSIWNMV
ncbi:neurofilament heavy polypeptide [Drosophila bipectinata]|uniref:neurofilament heavy polypeptide n=1 Tax=Drosophila bipectinata TaxID=42026 RepID=UPI0038B3623E